MRQNAGPALSVVVPVYNEAAVIATTFARLRDALDALGETSEILFVDDGSTDATAERLEHLRAVDGRVGIVTLSRNFGHQAAISAGLTHARGRAIVIIDADLQDPPELISVLVERWRAGADVVHARRVARRGERVAKRLAASLYYRVLDRLAEVRVPADVGDFRLIDRRVRDVLVAMPEHARYVRGLVAWAGFRQETVDFVREPRAGGATKYGLGRMVRLALDGVAALSTRPLYASGYVGVTLTAVALVALAAFAATALAGSAPPPWAFALAAVGAMNGATLVALGVVGAYLARVYDEVRGRPLYVVASLERPRGKAATER
jgi:glycosyltransferase involved in cell wall biosynthesis